MSENNESEGGSSSSPVTSAAWNPYSILNVSNHASIEEIQKSYKLLSRSFHPDKQPVQSREKAQQYFIQLKSAYDILMDPVFKFILDYFGHEGVTFLKSHAKLYKKVESLLKQRRDDYFERGEEEKKEDKANMGSALLVVDLPSLPTNQQLEQRAIQIFSEAIQNYNFHMSTLKSSKPIISGSVQVNCNTTHSVFLEEGIEPISLDVDKTKLAFTISQSHRSISQQQQVSPRYKNVKLSCSASSTLKSTTGEGMTSGQLSMEYEPVQGTEVYANVSSDLDMSVVLDDDDDEGDDKSLKRRQGQERQRQFQPKLEIGTSRVLTNRTFVHANVSAPIRSYIQSLCHPQRIRFLSNPVLGKEEEKVEQQQQQNDFTLSLKTHRSLFEDKIRCTWIAGLALPTMKLQYGMISISTNHFQSGVGNENDESDDEDEGGEEEGGDTSSNHSDEQQEQSDPQHNYANDEKKKGQSKLANKWFFKKLPNHTLNINLGMSTTPISVTTEQEFSETHSGIVSVGFGIEGWDLKVISTRAISNICKLSLGIKHVSAVGFSTLFKIQRGSINFTVPVLVTTCTSSSFILKGMFMSMLMGLFDQTVGDYSNGSYLYLTDINDQSVNNSATRAKASLEKSKEDFLIESDKLKRERVQQIELMSKTAEAKMKKEQMKDDGLVILSAKYEVQNGDSIDVTIPLQFWVMNSALHLPPMSKSNMLGFYDVQRGLSFEGNRPGARKNGVLKSWITYIFTKRRGEEEGNQKGRQLFDMISVPTLTVRYRCGKDVYEITILDHEELNLPSPDAMKLGGSYVL